MVKLVKTRYVHQDAAVKDTVLGDMFDANICKAIFRGSEVEAVAELAAPPEVGDTIHMRVNAAVIIDIKHIAGGRFAAIEARR